MRNRIWKQLLAITAACATLSVPLASEAGQGRGRARGNQDNPGVHRGGENNQGGRGRNTFPRLYQDPASATGYESGYERGLIDGRDGQRYDPVRHREYRDAEHGYAVSYGPKDGYKANFRTGFRQGYEDGYRDGTRSRK